MLAGSLGWAFLLTVHLYAQQLATLNVAVTAPSGSVISNARVTLKNLETGAKRAVLSPATGIAVIPGLPAGSYQLTVNSDQFSSYQAMLTLTVGQNASVPIVLAIKAAQETVEVRETAQAVDTQKSEVSQVIDTQKISDLPISGRDFIDFVLLTPTVMSAGAPRWARNRRSRRRCCNSVLGASRDRHRIFGLDGTDYTTSISGVRRVSPSQDWVREFRVAASPYTADNGRNLGSVVNTITKSGSNAVHGSVYEFFRNNKLDANNLLSAPGFNSLRFNQFGGDVLGPIRRTRISTF